MIEIFVKALLGALLPSFAKAGTLTVAAGGTSTVTPDANTNICDTTISNDDSASAVTVTFYPVNGNAAAFTLKAGESLSQKCLCSKIVVANATGASVSVRYIVSECNT